ncbi:hypothetical protein Ccrd_025139 [Cynara cardunculus var. scolymus]|uniref:Uncharacterized protein n=1 Tax=Cynara cardunculus var. scolymus TaxID=59895 RepID=A0A118JRQ4_CYNCS|nr:hypothetical protein Ccrd_025139 [Cynara cardunculus var. scolymus]
MDALQFHQHHHRLQISQMSITPISFSCNLSAATATLCLHSIVSKYFSTSIPKLCTSRSGKIEAISRVSADELKEQWLNSLTCHPLITETGNQIFQHEEGCGNGGILSRNVDSQFVIGIDPDVSGALAVLKLDDSARSAQGRSLSQSCEAQKQSWRSICIPTPEHSKVYDSPNVKVLVGNRVRRRLDTKAMVQLLRSLNLPIGTTAYIEQSLPFPADGKQGWWSGGFNYGLWIGVLVASEVSVVPVPSMRWKQEFKLCGNGSTKVGLRLCSLLHMEKA